MNPQGLIGLQHLPDILNRDLWLCALFLGFATMVRLLDQEGTQQGKTAGEQGDHHTGQREGFTHIADGTVQCGGDGNEENRGNDCNDNAHAQQSGDSGTDIGIGGNLLQDGSSAVESKAHFIQNVAQQDPGSQEYRVALDGFGQGKHNDDTDTAEDHADQGKEAVFTELSLLGSVHDPCLQGIVDGIDDAGDQQNRRAKGSCKAHLA